MSVALRAAGEQGIQIEIAIVIDVRQYDLYVFAFQLPELHLLRDINETHVNRWTQLRFHARLETRTERLNRMSQDVRHQFANSLLVTRCRFLDVFKDTDEPLCAFCIPLFQQVQPLFQILQRVLLDIPEQDS